MSEYTRALYFKNGDVKTITEKEADAVKDVLVRGGKWVQVQGALINADTIARVDIHHATAHIEKLNEADAERTLKLEGKGHLVEAKREEEKRVATESVLNGHRVMVGDEFKEYMNRLEKPAPVATIQTDDEVMRGDPAYWIDENGEKHYS